MPFQGTRTNSRKPNGFASTRNLTRDFAEQDKGSTNQLSASLTFTAAMARISGANNTFAAFKIGERFQVENTVTNDGRFKVTGIDSTNHAYITASPKPKDQGPLTAFLRKITS